jgi:PAS domain S-box-containing protein
LVFDVLKQTEDKRREDESEDIRLVVDTIPTLAWSARPDGSAEFFNQRWLDYTGLSAKHALGSGWEVAIHPDDLPRILETFREALDSVQPFEVEGRFRRFDGEFRWFLFRGSPLRDRSGKVAKWYGTNTDLEERKRAEEALRKSEERWRSVFENSAIGVALTDHNGRFLTTNHVFQAMMGYTEEELRALHILDLTHEDYRQANGALITELLEGTRRQFQIEKQHRRKDGSLIWVSNNVSLVPGTERVPRFIMALSEDITQRKRAEDTLRSSEAFLLDAQRLTRTCSWRHEVLSGKVTVSAEGLAMYGIEPEDDASSADFYHSRKHPKDRPEVEHAYAAALLGKTDFEAEFRIVLPDGTIKNIRSIGHPILDERGDVVEFVGASIDVTEHHRARADLEKAFEEIKRLRDQLHDENVVLREQIDQAFMFDEIVGTSSALQRVLSRLMKVAPTDSSVLVSGETGTGKELVARAIHKRSRRAQRPFVSVNCAALAPSLISSELFGHEKGAFTGALQRRLGRFELANGGTIFLDEIGELPLDTQVALLRVLQEREFERVGGTQPIKIDVRVIAATNRDLEAAVANGTFRADLYYRLNVFPIEVPPLRERQDDVLMLLEFFVHRFAQKMGKHFRKIDKRTVELFRSYPWPGNIRELQNVVERSVIVSSGGVFGVDAAWLSRDSRRVSLPQQPEPADADEDASRERQIIEDALAGSRGRVSGPNGAAARLRVPPSTLEHRIKKLRIRKNHFKLR